MNNPTRLDQWCLISRNVPGFQPPERERLCLHGIVTGHFRCADGKEITSSLIMGRNGNSVVTKSGSAYELGEVDKDYDRLFPEARRRLLAALGTVSVWCNDAYEI